MSALALKFRSAPIAIVVLLLSASLVLAGGGFLLAAGSGGATDGSAPTVVAEDEGEEDGVDAEDAGDHGDLVSEAAQMVTPEDFKNHGAFVSCVARMVYVDDPDAIEDIALADLEPKHCDGQAEDEATTDEDEPEADVVEDDWDNHGDLVSDAAQMDLPEGWVGKRGSFVSCVAKMTYGKQGSEAPADFKLAELTAEDCEAEDEAEATTDEDGGKPDKSKGKGKGRGRGNGRG